MSVTEIKKAINEKIEGLNEDQLKEVAIFITKMDHTSAKEWDLTGHINDIINERKEVLNKLAQ